MTAPAQNKRMDWVTPVFGLRNLHFESLTIDLSSHYLSIVHSAKLPSGEEVSYCFLWSRMCAYKVTDEEHWIPWSLDQHKNGPTHMVTNSAWIAELRLGNNALDMFQPNLRHFVICSDSFVIEVLSQDDPEILKLAETHNE